MSFARKAALALLLLALPAGFASAHGVKRKTLSIDHPMTFEWKTVADTAAVYMTIVNTGKQPDRLLRAETPMATQVTLHVAGPSGGPAEVNATALELTPGARLALGPKGAKLRLHGLKRVPVAWDTFPMTLVFEKAGRIKVDVLVEEGSDPER